MHYRHLIKLKITKARKNSFFKKKYKNNVFDKRVIHDKRNMGLTRTNAPQSDAICVFEQSAGSTSGEVLRTSDVMAVFSKKSLATIIKF